MKKLILNKLDMAKLVQEWLNEHYFKQPVEVSAIDWYSTDNVFKITYNEEEDAPKLA